ncbi:MULTISPECIES: CDP-alcohol phosphatidyltransferase family protein [unclassified Clostridioides]|nr:CDP-alcohol phosphatidyltransferase family protein [Clostridioides sp. ES-S-0001-02]MCC0641229.1 CDP-alcohol phosphatidyltransferase family protein [Clostridioides sp. ES-S-0049-03]MCC0654341.1 CDP-alcohol phosphatidyltransferase family protein [Clostridioides sp. ES-S-0001-03]MCC0677092.1 CDP-alcohol phosphatidyltransferase family protein [Clostridioides sp. ES-W-0018-02]MCC0695833.1 CDP-alcohol phosphatidyltransferase family protein [Clostridioides sp. ES-S-0048-02]MCC0703659.1 CDP-alcoho
MLDTHARKYVEPFIIKGAEFFLKLKLTPNNVTIIALIVGISTSLFIYLDMKVLAIITLWVSGYLDAVDGDMARSSNKTSLFGTLMDITFDRIVEISMILVFGLKMIDVRLNLMILLSSILMSMTIFLTVGALTDKKGMKSFYYQAGVAERSEGFILFTLMILFQSYIGTIANLFSIVVLFTAVQRLLEAKKIL